jgi:hypothetical protein
MATYWLPGRASLTPTSSWTSTFGHWHMFSCTLGCLAGAASGLHWHWQRDPFAILVAIPPAVQVTACLPARVAVGGPKQTDPFDSVTSCAPQEPATSLHAVVLGPSQAGIGTGNSGNRVCTVLAEANLHTSCTVLLHQFKEAKGRVTVVYTNADDSAEMHVCVHVELPCSSCTSGCVSQPAGPGESLFGADEFKFSSQALLIV